MKTDTKLQKPKITPEVRCFLCEIGRIGGAKRLGQPGPGLSSERARKMVNARWAKAKARKASRVA